MCVILGCLGRLFLLPPPPPPCSPHSQAALYSPRGCLRLLGEAADTLGAVAIPLLLVTLGANLARGPGVARGRLPAATCAAVVATRLVALPAVCGGLLLAAWRAGGGSRGGGNVRSRGQCRIDAEGGRGCIVS